MTQFDKDLETTAATVITNYRELMNSLHFSDALSEIWKLVSRSNKYIDETQPWVLAKSDDAADQAKLASVMNHLAESLRLLAHLLQPILTQAPTKILDQLGLTAQTVDLADLKFGTIPAGTKVVAKGTPIFPRLDAKEEVEFIKAQMTKTDKKKGRAAMEEAKKAAQTDDAAELNITKKPIRIEAFDKVELKVAEIKSVDNVEGADKLLKFKLDAGDKGDRQILSGIAEYYPDPSVLVGKKVLIVANLKPRKMRGEISQGMLLSAEHDGHIQVVEVPNSLVNGSGVE